MDYVLSLARIRDWPLGRQVCLTTPKPLRFMNTIPLKTRRSSTRALPQLFGKTVATVSFDPRLASKDYSSAPQSMRQMNHSQNSTSTQLMGT